jgi:hypothetical protein
MNKKKHYNFHEEFNHIDARIEQERYREAGYLCGYILEHMLIVIYEKFKGKAAKDVLDNIANITKGEKLNTSKLGMLIGLLNKPYRTVNQKSNRITPPIFKIVCQTLEIDYKRVKFIDFDELNDIRKNCVHPHPYSNNAIDTTKDEIEHFKVELKIIEKYFHHLFQAELTESHPSAPPPLLKSSNKIINIINYESVIIIVSITLVIIAAVIVYN